jgi:hypothetical protein
VISRIWAFVAFRSSRKFAMSFSRWAVHVL